MRSLLEKANETVIKINKLMGEIEDFESIISKGRESEIAFANNGSTAYITVLTPEKMQDLKGMVLEAIAKAQEEKTAELEKLLGIEKKNIINPEFKEDVQNNVKPPYKDDYISEFSGGSKRKSINEYPEMTVEAVQKLYIEEGRTYKEMAEYFGVNKSVINNFITRNHLRELKEKHDNGYKSKKECP